MGALHELWREYGDRIAFFVVYIKEAHPDDGWIFPSNVEEGIHIYDPASDEERGEVAHTCAVNLQIEMPVLIDGFDNPVASAYGAWPDRLYLIGRDGRIAYQGEKGPFGFKPEELGEAIHQELGGIGS